jgi:hypothetical protein
MIVKRATELKFVARFFASGFSTHRVPPNRMQAFRSDEEKLSEPAAAATRQAAFFCLLCLAGQEK